MSLLDLSFLDRVRGTKAVNRVGAGVSRNVRQSGDRFQAVCGEEVSVGQAAAQQQRLRQSQILTLLFIAAFSFDADEKLEIHR